LESGNNDDGRSGVVGGSGKRAKEIGGDPLAVLGGEGDTGYLDFAPRVLNRRGESTGEYDNGNANNE